jgi:hypothetical protein
MILIRTDHPYLRVGRHSWYQSILDIIHCLRPNFQKLTVRMRLDSRIRTIVVLTGGKLTGFYFLYLFYAIYYSVTTHRQKGKKLSSSHRVM